LPYLQNVFAIAAPLVNKNSIIADYKHDNARQIQAAYEYEQSII
jgi:hypothetical protein